MKGTSLPPDLQETFELIDTYLDQLRGQCRERLIIGRREYLDPEGQRWKEMPIEKLEEYLLEERLDEIVYTAFLMRRRGAI